MNVKGISGCSDRNIRLAIDLVLDELRLGLRAAAITCTGLPVDSKATGPMWEFAGGDRPNSSTSLQAQTRNQHTLRPRSSP
jgi:hypothetical protein